MNTKERIGEDEYEGEDVGGGWATARVQESTARVQEAMTRVQDAVRKMGWWLGVGSDEGRKVVEVWRRCRRRGRGCGGGGATARDEEATVRDEETVRRVGKTTKTTKFVGR